MKRRDVIAMFGSALAAWPLAVRAQQAGKVYRIGMLEPVPAARNAANFDALRKGLRELGYVEGQNLIFEYRSADNNVERSLELASELVGLKVDLIVVRGIPAALAAKAATATIPVVMVGVGEPLAIVASLAHPGGNITGMSDLVIPLFGKRVELIKELVPSLSRVAYFHNMSNPSVPRQWKETETAAHSLRLEAELIDARTEEDMGRVFETAVQHHVGALIEGGLARAYPRTVVDLAARNKLPVIYPYREFVEIGGLISYGANFPDLYFRSASFIDKIFRGAKPADLPIEQPTKFELVINLKTAKALGLTVPQSLLVSADEVIE